MKSGKFTVKEIMGLVLGIAATILIVMVMYSIIAPVFNRGEKTAESYFDLLEESLVEVDGGNSADFSMWQPDDDKREYYLIYFGDKTFFKFYNSGKEREFFSFGLNKNHICVCYFEDGEGVCGECKDLGLPGRGNGNSEGWVIGVGEKVKVTKGNEFYDFDVKSVVDRSEVVKKVPYVAPKDFDPTDNSGGT